MAYLSFSTDQSIKDAKKFSLESELNTIVGKIEDDQDISLFDRFLPTPFIRKKMGNSYRLIAYEYLTNSYSVVIMLKVLSRGSSDYKQFIANPNKYCESLIPSKNAIEKIIIKKEKEKINIKPKLKAIEKNILFSQIPFNLEDDTLILETKEWVDRISSKKLKDYRIKYHELLLSKVDTLNSTVENIIQLDNEGNIKILCRFIKDHNILLLIAPISINDSESDINKLKKHKDYSNILNSKNITENDYLRLSQRSYPSYILSDQEMWLNIENNREGNIAMSPEESQIVNHFRHLTDTDVIYPLFINGRPGSGKSTILQYLFADQLLIWYNTENQSRIEKGPLYLTYNDQLLAEAKKNVITLFRCNSDHLLNLNGKIEEKNIKNHFQSFQSFLLSLIDQDLSQNFLIKNYINFPKFKKLWNESMLKSPDMAIRKLTPELAWHIIRTYIKGNSFSSKEYFDSFSYINEFPRDEKTVSNSTYKLVFEKIWNSWYKELCNKNLYWDDQDLAMEILYSSNIDISNYTAIYCDEAQDFTRLELELIYRLSFFTKRKLYPAELKRVPFAFAGDPFQTLNPTGFNWSAMKSSFHEKIVQPLDSLGQANLKFNYRELSFNYRSSKNIVGLANLIQLMRGVLFNIKDIIPQKAWFVNANDNTPPVYFNHNDPIIEKTIKEHEELVIIVPAYEGYEAEFAKIDPLLSKFAFDADGELTRNIISPARAKGLEFNRVLLYKFGQEATNEYPDLLMPFSEEKNIFLGDREKYLPYEYFINNLYVAATRGQSKLFIVDTPQGREKLWNFSFKFSEDILFKYFEIDNNAEKNWEDFENLISSIIENDLEALSENRDDPSEIAKQFKLRGIQTKSSIDLRTAAHNFERSNQQNEAELCRAFALTYESKYKKAAKIFLKLDRIDDALDAYWQDRSFQDILTLKIKKLSPLKIPFYKAAEFMTNQNKFQESATLITYIQETLQIDDDDFGVKLLHNLQNDLVWSLVIETLVKELAVYSKEKNVLQIAEQNLKYVTTLYELNIIKSKSIDFAIIAYYANKLSVAVEIWESYSEKDSIPEYLEAKIQLTKYPEKLLYLHKLNSTDEIVDQYETNKNVDVTLAFQNIILSNLNISNNFSLSLSLIDKYIEINSFNETENQYFSVLNKVFQVTEHTYIKHTVLKLILFYIRFNEWKTAIDYADGSHHINLEDQSLKNKIRNYHFNRDHFHKIIVYNIAKSTNIRILENNIKKYLSDYLERLFLSKDRSWHTISNVETAGLAIENTEKYILALEFYESIYRNFTKYKKSDSLFARERWLKSKLKFGTLTSDDRHKKEAYKKSKEWDISISNISDFPEIVLPDLDYEQVLQEEEILEIGSSLVAEERKEYRLRTELFVNGTKIFEIEHIPFKDKFRIKSTIEDELVSLNLQTKKITGEVSFENIKSSKNESMFFNSEWKLYIQFSALKAYKLLNIFYEDEKNLIFSVPIFPSSS